MIKWWKMSHRRLQQHLLPLLPLLQLGLEIVVVVVQLLLLLLQQLLERDPPLHQLPTLLQPLLLLLHPQHLAQLPTRMYGQSVKRLHLKPLQRLRLHYNSRQLRLKKKKKICVKQCVLVITTSSSNHA